MPVLQALPEDSLQQILDTMRRLELEPGEHIFQKGQPVDAVYVVESGELSVVKPLKHDEEEEIEATSLGPGSYIGELGLFYDRTCMESVRVRGDTPATLWQLRREDFYNIIDRLAADAEDSKDECEIVDLEAEPPSIFVVSDGSGYSAGGAVSLALKQFEYRYTGTCQGVDVTNFPYIRYKGEIAEVARRARHEDALIVYTLMREEPRNAMIEEVQRAKESDKPLRAVDLYEPLLMSMEDLLGIPRKSEVRATLRSRLSDECINMVEAIEFTRKLDDGRHPELWSQADIILIGLSRAGKTPLSFFLAQRGFKVANYPVIPDEEPPEDLFNPEHQQKCVALTIQAQRLHAVRQARMTAYGSAKSMYSSLENCRKEVNWLKTFYMRKGPRWPVIDTTNGGVEETAAKVLKILQNLKGVEKATGQFANPSIE
ncbi:unnamed protein product [Effrenium voratum]|nr:unnamed protein product [Effrenium voratum]